MIKEGAPIPVVMKVSGHTTLEAFDKYIKIDSEDVLKALLKLKMFGGDGRKPKKALQKSIDYLSQPVGAVATGQVL